MPDLSCLPHTRPREAPGSLPPVREASGRPRGQETLPRPRPGRPGMAVGEGHCRGRAVFAEVWGLLLSTPRTPGTWPAGLSWPRACTELSSLQGGESASVVPPPQASHTWRPWRHRALGRPAPQTEGCCSDPYRAALTPGDCMPGRRPQASVQCSAVLLASLSESRELSGGSCPRGVPRSSRGLAVGRSA